MLARMLGVARLNVATFEDVEHDSGATLQAMLIVIVVSIATGVGTLLAGEADLLKDVVRHHGDRSAGGCSRCGLGGRRGEGHTFRATAVPVQEVHPDRRRRPGERRRRVGPRPRHLQGYRGGARGSDMGRERGAGHGSAVHLHDTDGRGDRERYGHRPPASLHFRRPASGGGSGGTGARPGGGRRSPGAQVRPRRPLEVGLHAGGDRGPGGGAPTRGGRRSPIWSCST